MKLMSMLSSGRKAALRLVDDRELEAILEWFSFSQESYCGDRFRVEIDYQAKNKKKALDNACPLQGKLGLLVVDAEALAFFRSIDGRCRCLELCSVEKSFYVVRFSNDGDPVVAGYTSNRRGKKVLVSPVFREIPLSPYVTQLPEAYEEFGVAFCDEAVVRQIKISGLRGFSIWDFESKTETTI